MKVFGDTVHFIALLSTGDRWHARAVAIGGEDTIRTLKHAKQPRRSHVHGCGAAEIHLDRASAMCPSGSRRLD